MTITDHVEGVVFYGKYSGQLTVMIREDVTVRVPEALLPHVKEGDHVVFDARYELIVTPQLSGTIDA